MNATPSSQPDEPAPDRIQRHLRLCKELAELAMVLARRAAAAAPAEWQAAAQPARLSPKAAQRTGQKTEAADDADESPRRETISPNLAFIRLASCVRQTIALESRIAAEQAATQARDATREATRAARLAFAARPPQAPAAAPPPAPPRPRAPEREIPSLLSSISRDLGIDLEDRRGFPKFLFEPPSG